MKGSEAEMEARDRCNVALDLLTWRLPLASVNEIVEAGQALLDARGTAEMLAEYLEGYVSILFPGAGRRH